MGLPQLVRLAHQGIVDRSLQLGYLLETPHGQLVLFDIVPNVVGWGGGVSCALSLVRVHSRRKGTSRTISNIKTRTCDVTSVRIWSREALHDEVVS